MKIIDLKDAPQHLPLLAEWHQQQWADINPDLTLDERKAKMEAYLNDTLVPSTFVAINAGEVLGSVALVEYDMKIEGCTPWIASVYVHPEFRNQGIGSKLVLHTMEQARQGGVEQLYLFTPDQSGFYSRLGWEVMSVEPYYGKDVTIMKINLL